MPFGKIILWVSTLGLIGLGVGLAIGAAIFVVPMVVVGFIGWYIYKRSTRPRYGRSGW